MTVVDDVRAPEADKEARARAALRRAELATGIRRPAGEWLRSAASTGQASTTARPADPPPGAHDRFLPVHDAVASLFPGGALRRGTTMGVHGSTGLLLAVVARASRAGAWTAAVGFPDMGVLAASDIGVELSRLALVPAPGPDTPAVIAALLDGMDVVLLGPRAVLLDGDRRRLAARARERGSVIVSATPWPGAHVVLTVRSGSWSGVDHGAGWLRHRTLRVDRAGRAGAARGMSVEVELPFAPPPVYARRASGRPAAHVSAAVSTIGAGSRPGMRLVG